MLCCPFQGVWSNLQQEATSMRPDCIGNLQLYFKRLLWPAFSGACSAYHIAHMICCQSRVRCSHSCHFQRQSVRMSKPLIYVWLCAEKFFWFLLFMTLTLTWYTCEYLLPCMVATSPETWFCCFSQSRPQLGLPVAAS